MAYIDDVLKAAKSVPIFPCRAKDSLGKDGKEYKRKRPHITKWRDRATQDPKTIRQWWKKWPDALVGMPTGRRSGKYAIDLDQYEDESGLQLLKYLPGEVDDEFDLIQHTKRGAHVIYSYDSERPLGNGTDVFHAGIDVRGEGGYILLAPSPGYTLDRDIKYSTPIPAWLFDAVADATKRQDATRDKKGGESVPPEQVIEALNLLDPADYRDYGSWTRIMMMCYHGSEASEDVKNAFKDWSARDADAYTADTEEVIDYQWDLYATERENILTFRSLVHEVQKKHGAYVPGSDNIFADIEFDDGDSGVLPDPSQPQPGYPDDGIVAVDKGTKLERGNRGIRATSTNLFILLRSETVMGKPNPLFGLFRYNELSYTAEFTTNPPWAKPGVQYRGVAFDDHAAVQMMAYLGGKYRADFSKEMIIQVVFSHSHMEERYHPVRDYLNGLEWDGRPRIDRWLIEAVGAKSNDYVKAVSRKFLIGAAARGINPGEKMDTMIVLEGAQGIRKSTLIKTLGGEWYRAPMVNNLASKEAVLSCLGAWICEV